MAEIIDKFGQLDAQRAREQVNADAGSEVLDHNSVLDSALTARRLAAQYPDAGIDKFSTIDSARLTEQVNAAETEPPPPDTDAPAAPVITGFSSDTGAADNVTTDTVLVISGTAEAGSTVRVFASGDELLGVATGSTNWTFETDVLASGNYEFRAKATDASDNVSSYSNGLEVLVVAPPVAHWTFDTGTITGADVEDVTGNGHTGELAGSPAIVAGIVGDKALSLDGVNDFFEAEHHAAFNSTSVSISIWLKNITSAATKPLLYHGHTSETGFGIDFRDDSGDKRFRAQAFRAGFSSIKADFDLPDGADAGIHHYVFVFDEAVANNWYIYKDKVKDSPVNNGGGAAAGIGEQILPTTDDVYIGNYPGNGQFLAVDKVDDVRYYNRALTQAEVDAIFDGKV